MQRICLYIVAILFLARLGDAQTPDTVIAGPDGPPRLVKNEAGGWSRPIRVFSNAEKIVYVPDISTPGWAQWHAQEFKERGTYFTYVYTYLRDHRATVQDLIYVNTKTEHIVVRRFLKPTIEIDLNTAPSPVVKTTTAITKLVQQCVDRFQGQTIQQHLVNDKYLALHNLYCATDPGGPDCGLSLEDLQKKHPMPSDQQP